MLFLIMYLSDELLAIINGEGHSLSHSVFHKIKYEKTLIC